MNTTLSPNLLLDLSFEHSESYLQQFFEDRVARSLSLVLTDNSTSMLSARTREGILHVRLHRMFTAADSRVLDEIVLFLKGKRVAMPWFRKHIRDNREQLGKKQPNRITLATQGRFHDLRALYDEVNSAYFGGAIHAAITWGTGSAGGAVRKRTVGSYSSRSNTIRINPVLDRKQVPRYYVAFVVYHEMLHAAMGVTRKGERRSVHPAEFREREKLFEDYNKAREWERAR